MNGIKFLLDTNILIGLLSRNAAVNALLVGKQVNISQCAYSAVTRMELLSYHELKEFDKATIERLLSRMRHLPITLDVEDATIAFKRKHKGKLPDAIIAATAIHYELELLTLDAALLKEFHRAELKVGL
jgi:predicted nucleic acid-binding protein